jgi:hypothetical protein
MAMIRTPPRPRSFLLVALEAASSKLLRPLSEWLLLPGKDDRAYTAQVSSRAISVMSNQVKVHFVSYCPKGHTQNVYVDRAKLQQDMDGGTLEFTCLTCYAHGQLNDAPWKPDEQEQQAIKSRLNSGLL